MPKRVMGSLRHLKRHAAPAWWPIPRKEYTWTVKPSPGPHPIDRCIPLLIIVRDILKYAKTAREARRLIAEGHFKVDGRVRKDYKFPVGLMDVLEVVDTEEYYRIVPHPVKFLTLHKIDKEEASFKLCRIENKTVVTEGHIQLNLHDGRNHLVRVNNPLNPEEDVYRTYDVVKIAVPKQEILDHIKCEEGVLAITIGGKNVGRVGRITRIEQFFKRRDAVVTLKSDKGKEFRTNLKYVFPIGQDEPLISLPEEVFS